MAQLFLHEIDTIMSKAPVIPAAVFGVLSGIVMGMFIQSRRRSCFLTKHPPGSPAHDIESHILETQKPSHALGIRVVNLTGDTLTLQAPLDLNHNVHGTALQSVSVLCSYYLFREWLMRGGLSKYQLVAKTGSIRYIRPVTTPWIVATSRLPSEEALESFRNKLASDRKATLEVSGHILQHTAKVACEYTVEVCAYLPR